MDIVLTNSFKVSERCGEDVDVVTSLCAVLEEITDRQLVL